MVALFKNRIAYLGLSLILLIVAFPLISLGTSHGPSWLWWVGLLALTGGGLIPPVQRLIWGPPPSSAAQSDAEKNSSKSQ